MKKFLAVVLPLLFLSVHIWILKFGCLAQIPEPSTICKEIFLWPPVSQNYFWEISFLEATIWMVFVLTAFFLGKKYVPRLFSFIDKKDSLFSIVSVLSWIFALLCSLICIILGILLSFSSLNTRLVDILIIFCNISIFLATAASSLALIRNEKQDLRALAAGIASVFMFYIGIPLIAYILYDSFK